MKSYEGKLHVIHLIDCIYFGQLNSSYQRDGFGVQQTFQFDTYLGYWHNNKPEGLGLVILANGIIIYANFNRENIDGLAIVDDGDILTCGIYRNHQMVGVGFEYNYSLKLWKMQRYHKGIAIEVIKQQYSDISNGSPKIINVQQSIYFHLHNYLNRQYFPNQQDFNIVSQISQGVLAFGYRNSKGAFGPGICLQGFFIVQGGFYQQDQLHGFGFKKTHNPYTYEFGCYHKGRKDGPFMEKDDKQVRYNQYRKNILLKNLPQSQSLIYKNQKKYNYNCKDFFSAKNIIPFQQLRITCFTPDIRIYNQRKNQLQAKNKPAIKNSPPKKQFLTKSGDPKNKGYSPNSYIIAEQKQKSSVQIMRQKMNHYYGIVTGKKKGYDGNKSNSMKKGQFNQDDDDVAKQENPFT